LNSQLVIRATVCAALVVVCLAGAGWFPTQSAAGQESRPSDLRGEGEQVVEDGILPENSPPEPSASADPARDQQIYRSGLRNSFMGHQLSAEELNLLLAQLRHKTGFVRMLFDEAGFLTIDDRSQIAGGSALARELLLAAVDGKISINLQSHNQSPGVVFARVGERMDFMGWPPEVRIEAVPIQIDFTDFKHLRGDRKAVEAFDLGFVILHELCHAAMELHDPSADMKAAGDCESYVNRIRRELGVPERRQYAATPYGETTDYSGSIANVMELIFTRPKTGREPGSSAKTKTLYLTWNTRQVGKTRGVSAPQIGKEKAITGVMTH